MYDWAPFYHFYLKIYLETGAPSELTGRSTRFPPCNIWFTWTVISAGRMTAPKVSDVAPSDEGREKSGEEHVSRMRLMSKFDLLLSQVRTQGRRRTVLQPQGDRTSPPVKQGFPLLCLTTFFSFSTQYGTLNSVWIQRNFLWWDHDVSAVCVSVCDPITTEPSSAKWPRGPRALRDPNLARDPGLLCTTSALGL